MKLKALLLTLLLPIGLAANYPTLADESVRLNYSLNELHPIWRDRIQSFLDKDVIPLIDLESRLKRKDGKRYLEDSLDTMDALGIALIAFDTNQAKKDGRDGYRWETYSVELTNAYPDRFIPTTNGGTNRNWFRQKDDDKYSYIYQLEKYIDSGEYAIMGELEVRHYWSNGSCKRGGGRDIDMPLNSENGHRLFSLSERTGVPFVIHLEPEDKPLEDLEQMLSAYPGAKVIIAHFTQIRNPSEETKFDPQFVRYLLSKYSNLYYDLSIGEPGRRYKCTDELDTYIWKVDDEDPFGRQEDKLKPEYKDILNEFSDRFVAAFDYGGGRPPLATFLHRRVSNIRLIISDLSTQAKHNIGYRNAWKLLTGKDWD